MGKYVLVGNNITALIKDARGLACGLQLIMRGTVHAAVIDVGDDEARRGEPQNYLWLASHRYCRIAGR